MAVYQAASARRRFGFKLGVISSLITGVLGCGTAQAADPEFDVGGYWRLRYETLNNPIFPATEQERTQHNQRLSSKLLLKGQVNWDDFNVTVEMQDARVWLDNDDPTLKSSQVNTLEPLQYFVRYAPQQENGLNAVTVGRVAIDHGSRRLLAKGVFRNAINAFDGVLVDWDIADWDVRTFYLLPASRLPSDAASVDANERAFDKSYSERALYGVYANSQDNTWFVQSYWLDEDDSETLATTNRQLYTLSVQYKDTLWNDWKGDIELIGQTGTQHRTKDAEDTTQIDHRAWLLHASLGHDIVYNTFLSAEIDIASGDNNPADEVEHSFDGLYGVRRFDFGPTDVYQAMPRENIIAPGLRSVTKFAGKGNLMLGYKSLWYHQTQQDVDSFIGHQVEARLRWQYLDNLRLEFGGAYLNKGDGLEYGDYQDNSVYAYSGFLLKF